MKSKHVCLFFGSSLALVWRFLGYGFDCSCFARDGEAQFFERLSPGIAWGDPKRKRHQYFPASKKRRRTVPVSNVKPTAAPSAVLSPTGATGSSSGEDSDDMNSVENSVLFRPKFAMKAIKKAE